MRNLIPYVGETRTQARLDELFNRQTLGSVVFGGHLNKIVEKVYNAVALSVILVVLGVEVRTALVVSTALLLVWFVGLLCVVYVFVKWERVIQAIEDAEERPQDADSSAD